MFQSRHDPTACGRQFAREENCTRRDSFAQLLPELIREFVRFAGWPRLIAALATIVAGAVLEGVGILVLLQAAQLLLVADTLNLASSEAAVAAASPFAGFDRGAVLPAVLALVAFAIIGRGIILTVRDTLLARLQHGFVQTIKLSLLERLSNARWADIARHDRSVLVQMLGSEMMQLAMAVHYGLSICVAGVFLIAMSGIAIYLAPALALLILAFVGSVMIASWFLLHRSSASGKSLLGEDMAMSRSALRFVDTIKLAKAHHLQRSFLDGYAEASDRAVTQRVTFARLLSASRNGLVATGAVMAIAAMVWGTLMVDVPALELMAFVVMLTRLGGPALTIQLGVQQIANSVPRFALARQLTRSSREPNTVAPMQAGTVGGKGAEVKVEQVSFDREFGKSGGQLVDVSFHVGPGEILGLFGPSGAGKTTLLDVVGGLLEPSAGTVRVNGCMSPSLRSSGGIYLGQEPGLYAGTIRENMLWFAPGRSDDHLREALLRMGGWALLQSLERDLDTWLVDGGGNLSAGERQRVALARGLLREPRLILLDEATNSLDVESEASVLEELRTLPTGPTIIVVSHRRETLSVCDRIIEMADGRLLEPAC